MKWDIENPQHRRVLETARAWGISPSRFMGAQQRVTTTEIDGTKTQTYSAEWTEDDRQAAVELLNYEASLCPKCRNPLAESTIRENEFRYKVDPPKRCHACTAIDGMAQTYEESPAPDALFYDAYLP